MSDTEFVDFVNNFDLFFCCETWQCANDNFELKGYNCLCVPRIESVKSNRKSRRGHDGICLFMREQISNGVHIINSDSNGFMWVKLCKSFFNLETDIYVCVTYIPPSDSVYFKNHDTDFFEQLEQGVRIYSELGNTIIVGDLNARTGCKDDFSLPSDMFETYIPSVIADETDPVTCISCRKSEDSICNASGTKLLDLCKSTDLRIVNGRVGDDDGIGRYTFLANTGKSVIDYVISSQCIFSLFSNFIVHDSYSWSPHRPVQLNVCVNYDRPVDNVDPPVYVDKIFWNVERVDEFKEALRTECINLDNIVNDIVLSSTDVNEGIQSFSTILYNTAYNVFGKRCKLRHPNTRKNKNPWFTDECERARNELKHANKQYRRNRTDELAQNVINKRRVFKKIKRKAKAAYNNKQKIKLHDDAQSSPKKFWETVRKFKNKKNKSENITIDEFYNHFKDVFSDKDNFTNVDVESGLSGSDEVTLDELDREFTLDEVDKAIASLKRGKSPGIDNILPEVFIESKQILAPLLCKLFNFMYNKSIYPESWTKSVLIPIPKKGDLSKPDNYRGIMLTSIFSKVFSLVLDARLRKWAENNNVLTDYQFGFRQHRSTIDCVFILQSLLYKVLYKEKRKLYCAFIDFRKAFDLVYRNGIWYKLLQDNVSTKFVNMLQSMYKSVKVCIRANSNISDFIDSYTGVKQGETLSPLLFIMFLNDMYTCILDDDADLISLNELQLFLLLFADDTVMFSYTANGLQILLNKLRDYCNRWNIQVNTSKTVAMVCKKGSHTEKVDIYYGSEKLKVVKSFTYLGVTLTSSGTFYQTQKHLSEQALKATFSLNALFDTLPLQNSEKIKLFDMMVLPILNYGSEIWGFHKAPDIERVYLKFLKQVLHVRKQTPNASVYGEFGKCSLDIVRKERILKYLV